MINDVPAISSQTEASIRMAAAGARNKVARAEYHLALCIAQEHTILGQLYQELASQAGRQATTTDLRVDQVRHSIQEQGFDLVPCSLTLRSIQSPTKKRKSIV